MSKNRIQYGKQMLAASLGVILGLGTLAGNAAGIHAFAAEMPIASVVNKEEEPATATPVELNTDGLTPISAEEVPDGTYEIEVESSSSMFRITSCTLTKKNGKMEAAMTLSGTGYLYLYMGTGKEAEKASESEFIGFTEDENGAYVYTVPVEALDQEIDCAAFSKRKETWYDRTLIFSSANVEGLGAIRTVAPVETQEEDGDYTMEVTMEGGSGRASITSPAKIRIADGLLYATIEWSSPNYDYMLVNGEKYLPVNEEGNSTFEIPVLTLDTPMTVIGDTTAMSEPHEIEYQLTFASDSLAKAGGKFPVVWVIVGVIALVVLVLVGKIGEKNETKPEKDA